MLVGCGYRFVVPDARLPGGTGRVQVPVFANGTPESGAEAFFTEATREALLRAGTLGDEASPDVLEGNVVGINSGPLVAGPGRLPNYRMTATVVLTLKRAGKPVASVTASANEDFPPGADVLWLESNRGAALRRLAAVVIRDGLDKLTMSP